MTDVCFSNIDQRLTDQRKIPQDSTEGERKRLIFRRFFILLLSFCPKIAVKFLSYNGFYRRSWHSSCPRRPHPTRYYRCSVHLITETVQKQNARRTRPRRTRPSAFARNNGREGKGLSGCVFVRVALLCPGFSAGKVPVEFGRGSSPRDSDGFGR